MKPTDPTELGSGHLAAAGGAARARAHPQTTFAETAVEPGSFYGTLRTLFADRVLKTQLDQLRKQGSYDAFRLGWCPTYDVRRLAGAKTRLDGIPPSLFWESDVGKWIEAACYFLSTKTASAHAAEFESAIAELVDMIAAAQQEDGYLNVYFTVVDPEGRLKNMRDMHEMYNAGHLLEGALAHYHYTGSRKFLDAMIRNVDCFMRHVGPDEGQLHGYPGHPELELALLRLHAITRDPRHEAFARYLLEERGRRRAGQGKDGRYFVHEADVREDEVHPLTMESLKDISSADRQLPPGTRTARRAGRHPRPLGARVLPADRRGRRRRRAARRGAPAVAHGRRHQDVRHGRVRHRAPDRGLQPSPAPAPAVDGRGRVLRRDVREHRRHDARRAPAEPRARRARPRHARALPPQRRARRHKPRRHGVQLRQQARDVRRRDGRARRVVRGLLLPAQPVTHARHARRLHLVGARRRRGQDDRARRLPAPLGDTHDCARRRRDGDGQDDERHAVEGRRVVRAGRATRLDMGPAPAQARLRRQRASLDARRRRRRLPPRAPPGRRPRRPRVRHARPPARAAPGLGAGHADGHARADRLRRRVGRQCRARRRAPALCRPRALAARTVCRARRRDWRRRGRAAHEPRRRRARARGLGRPGVPRARGPALGQARGRGHLGALVCARQPRRQGQGQDELSPRGRADDQRPLEGGSQG